MLNEQFVIDLITGDAPRITYIVLAVIVAFIIVNFVGRGTGGKDPTRAFTAQQRRIGFDRAQHQCEFNRWFFFRCTVTATHADHFFPHAKGGASSMRNLVAACARHNLSKGARLPSRFLRTCIQMRRTKYFPDGVDRTAGEWFR